MQPSHDPSASAPMTSIVRIAVIVGTIALLAAVLFRVLVPGQTTLNLQVSWFGSAVATGIFAPLVFALLTRIDAGTLPTGEGLDA